MNDSYRQALISLSGIHDAKIKRNGSFDAINNLNFLSKFFHQWTQQLMRNEGIIKDPTITYTRRYTTL